MPMKLAFSVLTVVVLVLAACQTTSPRLVPNLPSAPPKNAKLFQFKTPPPGTVLTFDESLQGKHRITTHHYLRKSPPFEGKSTYRVAISGTVNAYDAASGNLLARYDRTTGDLLVTNKPNAGLFHWPLWVGKRWSSSYVFENHKTGARLDPVETVYEVEGIETLVTKAGRFRTLRIVGLGGANNAYDRTIWFDPARGLHVKVVMQGQGSNRNWRAELKLDEINSP